MADEDHRHFVLAQLIVLEGVRARAMFGGQRLRDRFFGDQRRAVVLPP
jgi:hypothetical protein